MKIKYAIMGSDDNPLYLDFWPIVSELWNKKFGITPVLAHFGTANPSTEFGRVIKMPIIKEIPLYVQCQWSRYYLSCNMNDICIISDIDMLPLSKFYFVNQLRGIPDDKYVHLNPCLETYPNLPACYHVAHSDIFKKVLGNHIDFNDSMVNILRDCSNINTTHADKKYWYIDEKYSTMRINQYPEKTIFKLIKRDGGQNGHRIDRSDWWFDPLAIKDDWYYDCHSMRPYSDYRIDVDMIKAMALNA